MEPSQTSISFSILWSFWLTVLYKSWLETDWFVSNSSLYLRLFWACSLTTSGFDTSFKVESNLESFWSIVSSSFSDSIICYSWYVFWARSYWIFSINSELFCSRASSFDRSPLISRSPCGSLCCTFTSNGVFGRPEFSYQATFSAKCAIASRYLDETSSWP